MPLEKQIGDAATGVVDSGVGQTIVKRNEMRL